MVSARFHHRHRADLDSPGGADMAAMTGRDQVERAVRWIRSNKEEFLQLQRYALYIEGLRNQDGFPVYQSITCGSIYLLAERHGIGIGDSGLFRRNKSLWSTLARYIVLYHPHLSRVISFRDSPVDRYVRANGLPKLHPSYRYVEKHHLAQEEVAQW